MPTGMWVLYILLEVMFLERRKEFDKKKKLLMYRRRWYYRHFGNHLLNRAQMRNSPITENNTS